MPIFIEVQTGPCKGQRTQLHPGRTLRVGRTSKSDLTFAGDSLMSGVHFALQCSENGCSIRDLNSLNGTSLNGQKVTQSALRHGDTILAGATTFLLSIEPQQQPSVAEPPPPLPAAASLHDRLLFLLRRDFQSLYAILDAARDIKILPLLLKSNEEHQSLYEGTEGARLAQVAPYLINFKKDSTFLDTLVRQGWGHSWGVFLTSPSDFREVRRHFRHFLEVELPSGKQVYFRFYDPRVLRVFLPTCTPEDTNRIFGPVQSYLLEDESAVKLSHFVNRGKGSERAAIALAPNVVPVESASVKP
jgi:Domain of unknown function (DUF4123)/Inner membrane component of T3SS, cytoplasmic domain